MKSLTPMLWAANITALLVLHWVVLGVLYAVRTLLISQDTRRKVNATRIKNTGKKPRNTQDTL